MSSTDAALALSPAATPCRIFTPGSACAMCWPWAAMNFLLYPALSPDGSVFQLLCKGARILLERLQGFPQRRGYVRHAHAFAFYQDVLGFPAERDLLRRSFPSPFPAANRKIVVIAEISTTYRERERHRPAQPRSSIPLWPNITATTGSFFRALPAAPGCVPGSIPGIDSSSKRNPWPTLTVLPCSLACNSTILILLLLVRRYFAEGVDYPGDMLIGVIIVGPGLPAWTLNKS